MDNCTGSPLSDPAATLAACSCTRISAPGTTARAPSSGTPSAARTTRRSSRASPAASASCTSSSSTPPPAPAHDRRPGPPRPLDPLRPRPAPRPLRGDPQRPAALGPRARGPRQRAPGVLHRRPVPAPVARPRRGDGRSRSVLRGPRWVRRRHPVRRGRGPDAVPDPRGGVRRRLVGAPQGPPRDDRAHRPRRRGPRRRGRPRRHGRTPHRARARQPLRRQLRLLRHGEARRAPARHPHQGRLGAPLRRAGGLPRGDPPAVRLPGAGVDRARSHPAALRRLPRPGRAARAAALFRESAGHWSRLAEMARTAGPDPDAAARRALFDEFAALVEQALALERRAVADL